MQRQCRNKELLRKNKMILYAEANHVPQLLKNIANLGSAETANATAGISNSSIVERIGNVAIVTIAGNIVLHSGLSIDAQRKFGVCDLDTVNTAIESLQTAE